MSRAFVARLVFGVGVGVGGTLAVSLVPREARAEKPWAPCKGCLVVAPSSDAGPAPLLVTLHGDIDHADTTAAPWIPAVRARGWALLGIECPVAEGCDKGSFWRWNGPVDWLVRQIAAVRARIPIDGAKIYVSGWSGGASYLGWHAKEIAQHVAGIVIHGGGVAPPQATCAPVTPPVYFLVGDQNPLHGMAKSLRTYFEGCGHPVTWDLLPRAGHLQELAAPPIASSTPSIAAPPPRPRSPSTPAEHRPHLLSMRALPLRCRRSCASLRRPSSRPSPRSRPRRGAAPPKAKATRHPGLSWPSCARSLP